LALENDRAAMASHISYITDVAQWDFRCTKSADDAEPGKSGWGTSGENSPPSGSAAEAAVPSSRGDQHEQQQQQPQPTQQQQISCATGQAVANGVAAGLGSSTSLDVPGEQQQQGVVGLQGFLSQQQQQQQQGAAGDAGPGARDVDASGSSTEGRRTAADAASTAEKVPSPVRQPAAGRPGQPASPRSPRPAPAEAHSAGTPKVLTCYAGGKTITTFPVSVPDTPEHSPMHSR
jgi:hypothetical protein